MCVCVCVCVFPQEEVAEQRMLSPVTVIGHLANAIEAGYVVDYRRGVLSSVP